MVQLPPKKAASSFNLGTVRKGQDDKMYKVVKRWVPVAQGARMVRCHRTVTAEHVRAYFTREIAALVTAQEQHLSVEQFIHIVNRTPHHIVSHCDFGEISSGLLLDVMLKAAGLEA